MLFDEVLIVTSSETLKALLYREPFDHDSFSIHFPCRSRLLKTLEVTLRFSWYGKLFNIKCQFERNPESGFVSRTVGTR